MKQSQFFHCVEMNCDGVYQNQGDLYCEKHSKAAFTRVEEWINKYYFSNSKVSI